MNELISISRRIWPNGEYWQVSFLCDGKKAVIIFEVSEIDDYDVIKKIVDELMLTITAADIDAKRMEFPIDKK